MQTKRCSKCHEEKPVVEFHKHPQGKYGVNSKCILCVRSYNKEYHRKHRERILARKIATYVNKASEEKVRARMKKWRKENKGKVNSLSRKRTASKLNRTPSWLTKAHLAEMEAMYLYNQVMPGNWHVDHIIPLQGKEVSGLHVPWNLQVITAKENRSKSNRLLK